MSREKILELLLAHNELTVKSLTEIIGISKQRIHRLLKELIEQNKVQKIGTAPKVVYKLKTIEIKNEIEFTALEENLLKEKYALITPLGEYLTGTEAFEQWCLDRNLPVKKTLKEYEKTLEKYDAFVDKVGLIDGTTKLKNTKGLALCIDKQFYADFYAIERFGKTKLGQLLHFGKMSQNKKLIKEIVDNTKSKIEQILKTHKIDAVGYIPPTLKRDVQIMKQFERLYNISLPILKLEKVKSEIIIPQKALSKLKDRITNAQNNIIVADKRQFGNVLLIDDALGSGATINETACKIKNSKIAKKVFGFAVTGSYKGFEVISEA